MNKQGDYVMEKNSRKIELVFLLIISAILLSATTIFASGRKLIKERSINTQPGLTLTVEASGADVFVKTWEKDEACIKIFGNSRAEEKMRFEIEKTQSGVKVLAKKKSSSWFNFFSSGNYDVRIEVMIPKNYNTDIETSGGDISIAELKGDNNLHTSGGDVKLNNTEGELFVQTSGGDIRLDYQKGRSNLSTSGGDIIVVKAYGDLKASTSGGDINIESSNGKIYAKTSGGDIELTYEGSNKGVEARTSGGRIHAKLPSAFKANVFLETSGGDIESNFDNSRTNKVTRSSYKAEYNGGGEKLNLETSGGDIIVDQI
jgi:hypothetical protein